MEGGITRRITLTIYAMTNELTNDVAILDTLANRTNDMNAMNEMTNGIEIPDTPLTDAMNEMTNDVIIPDTPLTDATNDVAIPDTLTDATNDVAIPDKDISTIIEMDDTKKNTTKGKKGLNIKDKKDEI